MKNLWKELMRKDEQRWHKKWERARQAGKKRFIIKRALLLGLLPALLIAAHNWIRANGLSIKGVAPTGLYENVIVMFIAGIIVGWFSGPRFWEIIETRYRNAIERKQG
jgi:hypothetical protein